MFIATLVPSFVAHRMNINFPWFVYFLIALALWFHTAGYIQGYYELYYPYYDKIAHLVSGITVALLGFIGVMFLDRYWDMTLTPPFIVGFTIIFGMALGAFWEIYEFLVDTFLGGSLAGLMQNSLNDTMLDMMFVLAGSIIVAIMGLFYFRKNHKDGTAKSMDVDKETK
jgi:ABC-type Fe3+-siderophore transport system permease subunit